MLYGFQKISVIRQNALEFFSIYQETIFIDLIIVVWIVYEITIESIKKTGKSIDKYNNQ